MKKWIAIGLLAFLCGCGFSVNNAIGDLLNLSQSAEKKYHSLINYIILKVGQDNIDAALEAGSPPKMAKYVLDKYEELSGETLDPEVREVLQVSFTFIMQRLYNDLQGQKKEKAPEAAPESETKGGVKI